MTVHNCTRDCAWRWLRPSRCVLSCYIPLTELTGHRKIALHSRDCAIARYVLHSCHCIARWTALVTVCMALAQAFVMCTFISHTCMLHIFMLLTLDVTYLIPTVVLACCTSLHTGKLNFYPAHPIVQGFLDF